MVEPDGYGVWDGLKGGRCGVAKGCEVGGMGLILGDYGTPRYGRCV